MNSYGYEVLDLDLSYLPWMVNDYCLFLLQNSNIYNDDLISFDVEDKHVKKPIIINDDGKCLGDSSPEYWQVP